MLRRFLYLDEPALTDYLSALEGGVRNAAERRTSQSAGAGGGLDLKAVSGHGERNFAHEETLSLSDTAPARYERLAKLASADPDSVGWVEVLDIGELATVGIGSIVEVECEVYVPDAVKMLSGSGDFAEALDQVQALAPFAQSLGLDTTTGLPSPAELQAMRGFIGSLGSDQVLVGEFEESDWRVAGRLAADHVNGEIDGIARVVGKVATKWPVGEWKPLLALPGMTLIPREQRRRLQRQKPDENEKEQYLEGPAVMLDLLAVYR